MPWQAWLVVIAAIALLALVLLAVRLRLRLRRLAGEEGAAVRVPGDSAVVLVHGLMGFDTIGLGRRFRVTYFRGVAGRLSGVGAAVYTPKLPPLASVPVRAQALADFVRELPHGAITLVAHSMGGLDARYAISRLGLAERVSKLVTIGTPHRGTPLADSYWRWTPVVRWLAERAGLRADALEWLTTRRMASFEQDVPDMPGVGYYHVLARTRWWRLLTNWALLGAYLYLRIVSGPNDGMVPVSSQKWGECLAEIEADHWAQIGWSGLGRAVAIYEDILTRTSA